MHKPVSVPKNRVVDDFLNSATNFIICQAGRYRPADEDVLKSLARERPGEMAVSFF